MSRFSILFNRRSIYKIVPALGLLAAAALYGEAGAASRTSGGEYDYCIDYYYDSSNYGWLAFQNKCSIPIWLHFRGNRSGSMTLRPGRSSSTGWTRSEMGAMKVAICPGGMIAKNASGDFWTGGQYYCEGD